MRGGGVEGNAQANRRVIPAQAGIQLIKDSHEVGQICIARVAEIIFQLDSRFRGNDELMERSR